MRIKTVFSTYTITMLKRYIPEFYPVKKNQTLEEIAEAFFLPPAVLVAANNLKERPKEGEVLYIPKPSGNLYSVQAGESKTLLCGSEENYEKKNKTTILYPGQKVFL